MARSNSKRPKSTAKAAHTNKREPAPPSAFGAAMDELSRPQSAFPNVPVRWLAVAGAIAGLAAMALAWGTLCLLYWQGSWQLLYHPETWHPETAILRTPASEGLTYEPVRFGASQTGQPRLTGWWLAPAYDNTRFTVLYLHDADGDLSDAVKALAALKRLDVAVFAIDYRGYGQSEPGRPSEKSLLEDAESALDWLNGTRHVAPSYIVVYGTGLGANLAAELASRHRELAGVVLDAPREDAMRTVFSDGRSRLVPAHWLVADRYDLAGAARTLQVPSLWLEAKLPANQPAIGPAAQKLVPSASSLVWLNRPFEADPYYGQELRRWLDDLPAGRK